MAQKAELKRPASDDVLLGTISADQTDPLAFTLLGQKVETDDETKWENLARSSLAGKRVKVEGSWKGPRRFRAESIAPRGDGRDRIGARIDELHRIEGGWEARLMIFTVFLADGTEVEHEGPVEEYVLAPERKIGVASADDDIERDEDDAFGKGFELTETLRLLGQLEVRVDDFNNFDLRSGRLEDRTDYEGSARIRLSWTPRDDLVGLAELRYVE